MPWYAIKSNNLILLKITIAFTKENSKKKEELAYSIKQMIQQTDVA